MTLDEWDTICLHMEMCWKGELDDERAGAYHTFLGEYPPEVVMAALRRLVQNGCPYLPTVPEIVAAVRDVSESPVPSWSEAYDHLRRALVRGMNAGYFASDAVKEQAAVAWLEEHSHPLVARFLEAQTYARLAMMSLDDPEYGALRQKDLREAWEEFMGTAAERQQRVLAAGSRRGVGPAKLDDVALLDRLRPESAGELPAA